MKNIANFFYQLNNLGFSLWLENGNLKYKQYKKHDNKNEIIKKIRDNKEHIVNFLNKNNHNSYDLATPQHIYKSDHSQEVLSFAQERLWFVEKYEGGSNAYNIPMVFKLAHHANLDLIERSIKSIVSRHEILRTLIKEDEEGKGYQFVCDEKEHPLTIERIKVTDKLYLDKELETQVNRIFDLAHEYPIKVCFYELKNPEDTEAYMSIVIHHIAFDGWSIDILLREFQSYYSHYLKEFQGLTPSLNLPDLPVQYKDFALWQRNYLTGERLDKQLSYWKEKLEDYETLSLITDQGRTAQVDYRGKDITFKVDESTSQALRELAKELKVSLYSLLLGGYYLMLKVYSNQDDIVIGTPVANRHYSQVENLIGFFINSLALRIRIDSKESVKEFVQRVGKQVVDAQLHQDLPFEKLVEELKVPKDTSRHPIFQVMFAVQNFGGDVFTQENTQIKTDSTNIVQGYSTEISLYNIARFDISTYIDDSQVCLGGCVNYAVSLYNEETIHRFIETYTEILKQLAGLVHNEQKQEQTRLRDLSYLAQEQYQQIIYTWNQTEKAYPNKIIHELFEAQVAKTPQSIAIIYEDQQVTYQQLNEKSTQLANYLRSLGAGPEVLIGIGIHREIDLIVGLLAILKTGAAYVPLDPEYPEERLRYMIDDSGINILLLTTTVKDKFDYFEKQFVYVDSPDCYIADAPEASAGGGAENLAYVIYTSGSTGRPKGVACNHKSVINRLQWAWDEYPFKKNEVCSLQSSICYVDSTWDIFGTLLVGSTLVLYESAVGRNLDSFLHHCFSTKVTRITLIPSFLEELIKLAQSDQSVFKLFENIRHLEVTGEFFKQSIFLDFDRTFKKNIAFLDCYGATEATSVIYKDFTRETGYITKIISNTNIYVLSDALLPVPIGAVGEIYIGGIGLARGYFNRPDLTAEKFIPNPFRTDAEERQGKESRLYKTGDLGRWLPDGNLEFIGRNDFQVKIRGHRIELGEIEAALSSYKGIKQSVVVLKERKKEEEVTTKYLVGYYVSTDRLNEDDILEYLQRKLPEYMVPTILVHLEGLPLTANNKLDRNSLPEPEIINSDNYVAPRNELENKVCQIWAEVLGLDKVGIKDNFFRLGGNSILAIKLVSKINKDLNVNIVVASIFKQDTVSKLVRCLGHNTEDSLVINKASINQKEERKLSFSQERLWFIEKYEEGTHAYNMSNVYKLSNNIKIDLLERSIKSIIDRHEVLRTLIKEDIEGNSYQFILNNEEHPFKILKIALNERAQLDYEIENYVNQVFNLTSDHPIRVFLFELNKKGKKKSHIENYLGIVIHHIAFDGWSYVVFFRELEIYYNYYLKLSQGLDVKLNLPSLSIQYADFALWQRIYLNEERINKQLSYWKSKLEDYETLNLITDKGRPARIDYRGKDISFEIDEDTSRELRELAKELKVSLYSLLLGGYYLMLKVYSNQDDIVIGTPVANRHYSQVENLIGFFANSLALRVQIDLKNSVKEFIQKVGGEVVEAQLHQDLPFEKLVAELKVPKDTTRHSIFQIMFGVQGFGGEVHNQVNEQNISSITNLLKPYITENILYNVAKFDISTFLDDSQICLRGNFNYAISLYNEETIHRFIETYIEILKQLATLAHDKQKQEQTKLYNLSYLNQEQYQQLIYTWNQTDKAYPDNKTIHELFEEQVKRTPENIAVVYEDQKLTYQQLNEKSNQLANYLRQVYEIKPDTLVALCLERSEHMLIAILAILKAGGAYVPMDPSYPDSRIKYILDDANTRVVLTNEVHQKRLKNISKKALADLSRKRSQQTQILAIDSEGLAETLSLESISNPYRSAASTDLAYVIYTSGTTGNPKGVLQLHSNVMRLFTATNEYYYFNSKDVWTLFHSYVFDFTVWEIWGALIYGGKLVIPTYEQTRDPNLFYELCHREHVTVLNQTPSSFYQFINTAIHKDTKEKLTDLRYVIFGGEALNLSQLRPWFNHYGYNQPKLVNMYGITETTVHVTYKLIQEQDLGESSHIGKVIPDLKAYVLDANLVPVPIGAVGELYVGGAGLARGYLNQPELTAERFIPNPFQTKEEKDHKKNTRLYKTGDLVRWIGDGNLEYIGRNDLQIKIRGYRIELGEIENALATHKKLTQSVVLAKEHTDVNSNQTGNKYLVAYYIMKELNLTDSDSENFVNIWKTVYQSEYTSLDINNFKQNIDGWNSSYTDKAIPKEDMLEWISATTTRIKQLNPEVILEIGSGSGLILFNIIESFKYYYATDFSANSIEYINKVIDKFGYKNKVHTLSCTADQLPYQKIEKPYETVIINSVVQYFPNLDYLESVIEASISHMENCGQIFIGDIRDYRLLKCFHYSIQKYKNEVVTKAEVEYFVKRDKELLVSPEYFIYLKEKNSFISNVEIMPKLGKASHEMNNYRYDVIVHIDKNQKNEKKENKYININEPEFVNVVNFHDYFLSNTDKEYLCIKYPNKRIMNDYIGYCELFNTTLDFEKHEYDNVLSVNEISEFVENKNQNVKFFLDINDPLYINIITYKNNNNNISKKYTSTKKLSRSNLANNPLASSKLLEGQLAKELKEHLSSMLPEYMVPQYYIQLESLPLTVNGKLDRKLLPEPEFIDRENYVAPRNELENGMCEIWAEVLGLEKEKLGIRDDFFRLGGNSILAIKLASKINSYYQAHLKVSDVFAYKNIEVLLLRMLQTKDSYQTIVKLNNFQKKESNNTKKPNMFMIHPGLGGCEVYISLADTLTDYFDCYGVDSYNLYNSNKIEDMHDLAKYYLSYIDDVMAKMNQETYHLLGWSIGGHIALEIACLLEKRGHTKIKVYLLDAVIYDSSHFAALDVDVEVTKKQYREHTTAEGYDKLYIEKSIENIEIEKKLVKQEIFPTLAHTETLFFKAMLGDPKYKTHEYHHIDKYFKSEPGIKLIKIIEVNNAHHGNILEQEELLVSEITRFKEGA